VPNGSTVAALINSKFPLAIAEARDMRAAAQSLGLQLTVLDGSTEDEINAAFAGLARHKVDVLLINTDPFLLGHGNKSCNWRRVTMFQRSIFCASSSMLGD
jgi:putative ABC transport system substrate-binding protein